MLRLLPFLKPYRWWFMLVGILLMLIALLTTLPPWLIQYAIDEVFPTGDTTWLLWLGGGILLLSLMEGLFSFTQQVLSEWVSQRVIFQIRNQLFHHLNQLSFSFFDRTQVGDLISRVVSDTDTLKRFIAFGLLKVVTNGLVLLWIFVSLMMWSPWMGFLFLLMIPFMVHAMWTYSFRVRPAFRRIRQTTGRLTSFTRERLAGIEVIKLFGNETHEENQFQQENQEYLQYQVEAARLGAFWLPYSEVLLGFFAGLVLLAGGWLVTTGRITAGSLVGFMAYVNLLNRPIRQTGFLLSLFQQADTAAERIHHLLDQESAIQNHPGAQPFTRLTDSLSMQGVSFAYDAQPVLQHVTFKIKAGETLAIVGPSGAGKTTLVHLLLRFYAPSAGEILLDDRPIERYTVESLREKIGLVMQHPFLFDGTLRDNIALGTPDATLADIQQAARLASLDSFIKALPQGYDTPIGERGVRLSGGQAQRLALARVLLRQPEILVLDEPTASVDHLTDAHIMESVSSLMAGKTLLVIAHRLATLRSAHRILFLEDGRITGLGTHHELVTSHAGYRGFIEASGDIAGRGGV
ncbi:ABC transporter ATP-binding protein [Anoxynatronum buryatiense]|uniref:ATP-binding cassette, subfamily B n=1 Tax=Anoxynatronum buryatiense TaxID=489973 RepID=A0AA46AJG7_9CLOT|nr:ABC transporter ATP-binding protein [Anoxynatronum buryatiense]SMP60263.1 ATP-binding cassette, subfamily B [Anoxynatronum buryatiense]